MNYTHSVHSLRHYGYCTSTTISVSSRFMVYSTPFVTMGTISTTISLSTRSMVHSRHGSTQNTYSLHCAPPHSPLLSLFSARKLSRLIFILPFPPSFAPLLRSAHSRQQARCSPLLSPFLPVVAAALLGVLLGAQSQCPSQSQCLPSLHLPPRS